MILPSLARNSTKHLISYIRSKRNSGKHLKKISRRTDRIEHLRKEGKNCPIPVGQNLFTESQSKSPGLRTIAHTRAFRCARCRLRRAPGRKRLARKPHCFDDLSSRLAMLSPLQRRRPNTMHHSSAS
jgi:hypothetical protein